MIAGLILAMLLGGTPAGVPTGAAPTVAAPIGSGGEADQSQEAVLYKQGTDAIDHSDWDTATQAFQKVAALKGDRADAALYWQAYALNHAGRREEALRVLAALKAGYPQSRWIKDAGALDFEIRKASGQTPQVDPDANDDLKLMALSGLMNADPDRALPLIEQMLSTSPNGKVGDRALFVLAQNGSPKAREVLIRIAKSDANPDLQAKAIRNLGLFGGQESRQTLVDIYASSQNLQVRKAVLNALMIGGDRARLAEVARKEASPELRREAINMLGIAGGRDDLWQMYQTEKDPDAKRAIINALFVGGGKSQLTELATKETNPEVRRDAIVKLGLMGRDTAPTLKTIYAGDKDPEVKRAVLNALFVQGNATALIEIARQEQDPAMKRDAVQKLSIMHSKEAADYMMELLK